MKVMINNRTLTLSHPEDVQNAIDQGLITTTVFVEQPINLDENTIYSILLEHTRQRRGWLVSFHDDKCNHHQAAIVQV